MREKCPYSKFFWSLFSCIWTEEIINGKLHFFAVTGSHQQPLRTFLVSVNKFPQKQFPLNFLCIFRNTYFPKGTATGTHYFSNNDNGIFEDWFVLPFSFKRIHISKRARENRRNITYSSPSFPPTHNNWYIKKQLQ